MLEVFSNTPTTITTLTTTLQVSFSFKLPILPTIIITTT